METVIAAVEGNRAEVVTESADLLYHLLVVLRVAGVSLDEVLQELQRRTAQTGLEEKPVVRKPECKLDRKLLVQDWR